MKLKKLFAGVLAGAMVLGCSVMPSSAATTLDAVTSGSTGTILESSSTTIDLTTADTIVVHANCSDTGWGWNNGSFVAQTTTSWAWIQVQYGGSECDGQSWFPSGSVVVSEAGDFDVTVSLAGYVGEGFNLLYSTEASAFSVTSVDIYAGSTLLATWEDGTWTAAPSTYDTTLTYEITEDNLAASSYTVTLTNTDGDTTTYTNNTYYVSGSSYYIGIDITDIPSDQTVSITSVDFN